MNDSRARHVTFGEKTYDLDDYGFLSPPEQWDRAFAEGMAAESGIHGGLTEEHWSFIDYLRGKFLVEETVPVVVMACADNGLRLSRFKRLFPTGYFRGACRIAGIDYAFMHRTNHWLSYETAPILKSEYDLSPQGFLVDFEQWDERFCEQVLAEWKLPPRLTERQREVIEFLRRSYRDRGDIPTVLETCRHGDLDLAELGELFPGGYRRGACRIAGLPFFA
ncbi:MAG: TusE/DsrC/DsvC family sulfur relay protein [Planctomycetota bacterium]|jgi:tRNA 2-thiouridine synthesizing protein E